VLYKYNLSKAKSLAKGNLRDGKITVYYRSSGSVNPAQAQIVKNDLQAIGFQPGNITMKGFSGGNIYTAMGVRGNDADMGVSMGWCSDYPDPYDWLNILLYGPGIQADNNVNYSYMNIPKWNNKLAQAAKMVGPNRYKTYGKLDITIMQQVAPVAATRTYNTRGGFFNAVSPARTVFHGGPGALEAVLRVSYIDLDGGSLRGGRFWRITPMVNWHLSDNVRLEAAYGYGKLDRFDLTGATQFFQSRLQLTF